MCAKRTDDPEWRITEMKTTGRSGQKVLGHRHDPYCPECGWICGAVLPYDD